jgi:hypothetical protein
VISVAVVSIVRSMQSMRALDGYTVLRLRSLSMYVPAGSEWTFVDWTQS